MTAMARAGVLACATLLASSVAHAVPKAAGKPPRSATAITTAPDTKLLYSGEEASKVFSTGLESFYARDYDDSAERFYSFLQHTNATFENYGWAQFFLADSLAKVGLTHAAVTYYYLVGKTRLQPEVIATALSRLETITRTQAFDENLVYDQLIYDSDFGTLPPELQSWVGYVQGLKDYTHGFNDWGDRHFKTIDPNSGYHLHARYLQAVHAVRERRDNEALDLIRGVLASPVREPLAKNEARLALARLLFERSEFGEAIANYDQVQQVDLSYEQGLVLTEKAWASYYVKDYVKALGYLHALGAPSYEAFLYPDTYLLRAIIYKDLCHYLAAKNVVRAFKFRYGRALEQLKQRAPLDHVERIRRAAIMEGPIARRTRFLQLLRREQEMVQEVMTSSWGASGLRKHVQSIYSDALESQNHAWQRDFRKAADRVALRLLETAEQVNVLDYETSLEIYKPVDDREATLPSEKDAVYPDQSTHVYYDFDGEYWNDELGDYQVMITSRCVGSTK